MRRVKVRIDSGAVCEMYVCTVPDRVKNLGAALVRRPRFKTEAEREEHRLGIAKRNHARTFNENFSPSSLYSTLTFDDADEVHTFAEARELRELFIRRLRYRYPDARLIVYMGRGKHTRRIHFHMVSEGIPETVIREQWFYGTVVRTEPLREHNYYNGIDHGQDYTGLANYLFDHWTEEQGGHRFRPTRNLRKPKAEEPKTVKRKYTLQKPPRAPKGYILVDSYATRYGFLHFKYVKAPAAVETPRPIRRR